MVGNQADVERRWQLVLPHREMLLRIARSRGVRDDDAEACVQEAMLRCVEFPRLDERRVVPFLVTTTTRLCVDRMREHAHDDRVGVKLAGWSVADPSPEDTVCDLAEAAWVARQVEALPERERLVLTARAAGMSCGEVADRFGFTYKTVESLLSRARSHVRRSLATTLGILVFPLRRLRAFAGAPAVSLAAVTVTSLVLVSPVEHRPPPAPPEVAVVPTADGRPVGPAAVVPQPRPAPSLPAPEQPRVAAGSTPTPAASPSPTPSPSRSRVQVDPPYTPSSSPSPGKCLEYGINWEKGLVCDKYSPPPPSPDPSP